MDRDWGTEVSWTGIDDDFGTVNVRSLSKKFKRVIKKKIVSIKDGVGKLEHTVHGYQYESPGGYKLFYRDEDMVMAMLEDPSIEIE